MYVLAFFAGLTFFFMAFAIFKILPRGRAEKRLKSLSTEAPVEVTPDPVNEMEEEEGDSFGHVLIRFLGRLSGAKGTSADGEVYADARRRLMEAGFRRRSAVSVYNGSRIALGGLLPVLLILIFVSTRTTPPMVVIAVSALVGYLIPGIILDNIRSRRIEEIRRGLSNAIDLMVVCVEAGLGLGATFERVAREFSDQTPVLSSELQATAAESKAGRSLVDALRSLALRCGSKELSLLTSLLIQSDRFGTPVVDSLRSQAESMRVSQMLSAEEQAQKAPVRMMLPAGLIFLAVLLILVGPAGLMITRALEANG
jgi:tight adherence protein C